MSRTLELFRDDSPFVRRDNRRSRPVLPVSADSLNRRHALLLPPEVVKGRSVLDLGCCLGATGHWALAMGAQGYTGVEHQPAYAQTAAELLAGQRRARIVGQDAITFLAGPSRRFGVVVLMGLVHGLFDPLAAVWEAARRARDFVCFEDFGRRSRSAQLVASSWMPQPIAGRRASSVGFGWEISPRAMEAIMATLGFRPDMAPVFIARNRWLCRYARTGAPASPSAYSPQWVKWTS